MSKTEWKKIKNKCENCMLQVIVETAIYTALKPNQGPMMKTSAGSGFIVDINNGIFLTNAHVVQDANTISCYHQLTGKKSLSAVMISIIRDKDIALCQLDPNDVSNLRQLGKERNVQLEVSFGDSLNLDKGEEILAAGFPAGEPGVKLTSGLFSGIRSNGESFSMSPQVEDSFSRDTVYLIISAPVSPGSSGGGIFNKDGQIVGVTAGGHMTATNINFGVPSRVIMPLYHIMLSTKFPKLPTLNLRWSNINEDTYKYLTNNKKISKGNSKFGILVRKVLPDSIFHGYLNKGDLLESIEFDLHPIKGKCATISNCKNMQKVIARIDSLGDTTLHKSNNYVSDNLTPNLDSIINNSESGISDLLTGDQLYDRRFSISEIVDYIFYGSPVNVYFNRSGSEYVLKTWFKPVKTSRIHGIYPHSQECKWLNIAGMYVAEATLNLLAECSRYKYIDENTYYDSFMFQPSLIICQVSPGSDIAALGSFSEGDILTKINGHHVKNIRDAKKILKNTKDKYITLESDRQAFIAINKNNIDKE